MKEIMRNDISVNQNLMFQNATLGIRTKLDLMCKQCRNTLQGRVQRMYEAIEQDYLAVIGTDAGRDRVTRKSEKLARKTVEDVILQSEAVFGEVLDCDVEQLESVMLGVSARVAEVEAEADVEDATEPLIELPSDGVDEDGMAELDSLEPELGM